MLKAMSKCGLRSNTSYEKGCLSMLKKAALPFQLVRSGSDLKMSHHTRKPTTCICEIKGADQLCSNCTADHRFVFTTRIVQFLFFLNPKFQASTLPLCLYMPVCVTPGRKPRRPVFPREHPNNIVKQPEASISARCRLSDSVAARNRYLVSNNVENGI